MAGFPVVILEVEKPTMVRRTVSFAQAIYDGEMIIEGIKAKLAKSPEDAIDMIDQEILPILIDPKGESIEKLKPLAIVDAILAKKNLGTHKDMASIVIGVGPGFTAGEDVHAVIETMRGHFLGRVILKGQAIPNTGVPGEIGGHDIDRVLRAPIEGEFKATRKIGDIVKKGEIVAYVGEKPVPATISGVLRGLLQDGLAVTPGYKIGDIDARDVAEHCLTISDKARSVGGGVLEALLYLQCRRGDKQC
jgi:xanthine dehydrogenase accessory factor